MDSNRDLIEALDTLEREKEIDKEVMLEAIETSLLAACKNQFGKADNIKVSINRTTGAVSVIAQKTVVTEVTDDSLEIALDDAKALYPAEEIKEGDIVNVEVTPKNFYRISAQKAKQTVVQKIREEERRILFMQYIGIEHEVVTGTFQRYISNGDRSQRTNNNMSINLGKVDALLPESEQIYGEVFAPGERIKVYVTKVEDNSRGPRITVSRSHRDLVKRLFEEEVTEVREGIVEIKSISREAGARTKMAVWSSDPNIDPVGACVGLNGQRVNAIVDELRGEKIDIIVWDEDPARLIENALSPAKVVSVDVDVYEKSAKVIVPDYQLSLAIGKEGQNARLAARLTGYKIDIKSESQNNEGYY
ncbi:MAG: transcription termination factor NusA [Lachnospiraceae bacterium]|nr:transcription termination factor NusA [Lachnospiraceae bacterium]